MVFLDKRSDWIEFFLLLYMNMTVAVPMIVVALFESIGPEGNDDEMGTSRGILFAVVAFFLSLLIIPWTPKTFMVAFYASFGFVALKEKTFFKFLMLGIVVVSIASLFVEVIPLGLGELLRPGSLKFGIMVVGIGFLALAHYLGESAGRWRGILQITGTLMIAFTLGHSIVPLQVYFLRDLMSFTGTLGKIVILIIGVLYALPKGKLGFVKAILGVLLGLIIVITISTYEKIDAVTEIRLRKQRVMLMDMVSSMEDSSLTVQRTVLKTLAERGYGKETDLGIDAVEKYLVWGEKDSTYTIDTLDVRADSVTAIFERHLDSTEVRLLDASDIRSSTADTATRIWEWMQGWLPRWLGGGSAKPAKVTEPYAWMRPYKPDFEKEVGNSIMEFKYVVGSSGCTPDFRLTGGRKYTFHTSNPDSTTFQTTYWTSKGKALTFPGTLADIEKDFSSRVTGEGKIGLTLKLCGPEGDTVRVLGFSH